MHQRDLSLFSVTPAASLLSRCVSVGALSQEEIDSASSSPAPTFSSHLQEVEEQIRMQKQLDEMQLQLELLKVDKQSSDVTHSFHLARRFQMLQMLGGHLQELLREQKSLRQRLMRPLALTNLPIQAHLHRFVVESLKMMMYFIESLEEKLSSAHSRTTAKDHLALLLQRPQKEEVYLTEQDSSLAQLLTQASEMETLSKQILQWKMVGCSRQATSDP